MRVVGRWPTSARNGMRTVAGFLFAQMGDTMNFTAIQIGKANFDVNTICIVAATKVRNSEMVESACFDISPIGGPIITPLAEYHWMSLDRMEKAPTFPKVWPHIVEFISGDIVVANTLRQAGVSLGACLRYYEMPFPNVCGACFGKIFRRVMPGTGSLSLNKIAESQNTALPFPFLMPDRADLIARLSVNFLKSLEQAIESFVESVDFSEPVSREAYEISMVQDEEEIVKRPKSERFKGLYFVFTGKLEQMERKEAFRRVEEMGGYVGNTINKNMTHLVVGKQTPSVVGPDGLSGKQRAVLEMKQNGSPVQMLTECEFSMLLDSEESNAQPA